MNDERSEPTVHEPVPAEDETIVPAAAQGRGVRWYHVVVLGLALVVCGAAVGFFVRQSSERDDATATREAAQVHLAAQRRDADRERTRFAQDRSEMKTALSDVAAVTTSLHEFSDLLAQEIDTANRAYALAMQLPGSADEFNGVVDQGNALIAQIQQKAEAIRQQVESIRGKVDGQFAAVRR